MRFKLGKDKIQPGDWARPKLNMKKIILLTTIGAMVTFGAARLSAQSTNTNVVTTITNVVQTVNISLSGFEQTSGGVGTSPVRITTRDILRDLQTATGTTFSSRARLTAVTPLGGGTTAFVVQDPSNTNGASTDVSGLLTASTVGTPVTRARTNPRNGRVTGTAWSIESFNYGSSDTNAPTGITLTDVQGFTTTQLANGAFNAQVAGTGVHNGDPIVVRGTINGSAGKFQEAPAPSE